MSLSKSAEIQAAEPRMNEEPEGVDRADDQRETDQVGRELGRADAEPERRERAAEGAARSQVLVHERQQPGDDENRQQQRQRGQQAGEKDAPDFAHAACSIWLADDSASTDEASATGEAASRSLTGSALSVAPVRPLQLRRIAPVFVTGLWPFHICQPSSDVVLERDARPHQRTASETAGWKI